MSNIGSFFNLGSQTTLVNENKARLKLKINPSQSTDISDVNFVFPANEGDASGYVLATDGSGTTSWVAQSGGGSTNPGGDANAIQFKGDDSDFSGVSNLTFDSSSNVLGVSGDVSLNGNILMSSGIRIGNEFTGSSNSSNAIAIGNNAGNTLQGSTAIAIGYVAGAFDQNEKAIAIGDSAGNQYQSTKAIAIGRSAGHTRQGSYGVAIGQEAGFQYLGEKSIAIGYQAEYDNSTNNVTQNVIVLNATDNELNSDVSSALFIKPLRDVSNVSTPGSRTRSDYKIMVYDSSSGEIAYDASYNGTANGGSTNPTGPTYAIQFNGGTSDFSGVSNLTFNSTTNVLGVNGDVSTNTLNVSGATNLNTLNVDGASTLGGVLTVNAKSDLSNVTVSSTLDVSGLTTLDGVLTVNAKSDLSNVTVSSTLDVSGATTLGGQLTVNADSSLNNVSISKGTDASNATLTLDNSSSLVMSPQIYTQISDFSGIDIQPTSSILIFDYSNNQNVNCSLNNPLKTYFQQGQHLSIFYLNRNASGNLRIDFGDNNIVTGSGANRYLTFTTFGQSAELLAYGNSSNTNNYLVFNSGADASS